MTWRLLALPPVPKDLIEVLVGDPRMEIVLIGSDSLETVRLTHANYFDGSAKVSKYFDLVPVR